MSLLMNFHYKVSDNFLNIFEVVNEDGNAWCQVIRYDKSREPTQKEFFEALELAMTHHGYCIFSFAQNVPTLAKKIKPNFIHQEGGTYCLFKLAPLLGLPGDNDLEELKELKEFLLFIKDKAVNDMEKIYSFQLRRGFGETCLKFYISNANDQDLSPEDLITEDLLNKEVNEKISKSSILTKWLENQKVGIENTQTEADNLFANLPVHKLMNDMEQKQYFEVQNKLKDKVNVKKHPKYKKRR